MDIESIREYILSLPLVTEDFPFDETTLVFRLHNKIFACIPLEKPDWVILKCDSEKAIELREQYSDIEGAYHWNKRYWNQIRINGGVSEEKIKELTRHAYNEISRKLPKKLNNSLLNE